MYKGNNWSVCPLRRRAVVVDLGDATVSRDPYPPHESLVQASNLCSYMGVESVQSVWDSSVKKACTKNDKKGYYAWMKTTLEYPSEELRSALQNTQRWDRELSSFWSNYSRALSAWTNTFKSELVPISFFEIGAYQRMAFT